MISGGNLIVKSLEQQGVKRVFCVPGESYLDVLDGLQSSDIDTVICRQEGGAAMMAEATGKLTGEPGICMVTRGPGATNASAGVHIASQDSTAMILFVGQINSAQRHREAFQEVDYQSFLGGMAKWVAEIDSPDRVPELVSRAFHVATSGRPGPVVLVLPEDALSSKAAPTTSRPWIQIETNPSAEQMDEWEALLAKAERPMAIVGGPRWSPQAIQAFTEYAEKRNIPVACSFRRQMLFDHLHPNYAGDVGLGINPDLVDLIQTADLLLVVGARLPEIASQNYTLLDIPVPQTRLVHVLPGAEELGKIYQPNLAIHASPEAFCRALDASPAASGLATQDRVKQAHDSYLHWSSLERTVPEGQLVRDMFESLAVSSPDAILTNGAGNYTAWIHRFWRFRKFASQVAPTSGSMGYGLPAAIAAKLEHPEQTVIAFAGDGCFQMTSQEFGTAVQAGIKIIVLVMDNGMYGTIRMHQELHYPGRVSATDLVNPDFAMMAAAYGAFGATITQRGEFEKAYSEALKTDGPALLHIKINPAAITPTTTISGLES